MPFSPNASPSTAPAASLTTERSQPVIRTKPTLADLQSGSAVMFWLNSGLIVLVLAAVLCYAMANPAWAALLCISFFVVFIGWNIWQRYNVLQALSQLAAVAQANQLLHPCHPRRNLHQASAVSANLLTWAQKLTRK